MSYTNVVHKRYHCYSKDLPQSSDLHKSKRVAQGRESKVVTKLKFQLRMSPLSRMTLLEEKKLDYVASAFPSDTDHEAILLVELATQTECLSQVKEKKKYLID